MKKNLSRLLSLVLVLVMVLTAIPASAVNMIRDGEGDWWNWWVQPAPIGNITHPEQTLTAELEDGTTVTVIAREGVLPAKTRMTAQAITNIEAVQAAVDQTAGVSGTVLTAVDITFMNGNMEVQPNGSVKVQIASDALAGMDDLSVVHLDVDADELEGDEQAELIDNAQTNNEGVVFSARHFSVYAVVDPEYESEYARLTVRFFHHDNDTEPAYTVKVTQRDKDILGNIIEDPELPQIGTGEMFCGWSVGKNYTTADVDGKHTIEYIRAQVKAYLENETVAEGDTFDVYAMVYRYFNVSYVDENGETTLGTEVFYSKSSSMTITVQQQYSPYEQGYRFSGWQKDDGDNTIYQNGSQATIFNTSTILRAQVQKGYWLSFEENPGNHYKGATYNAPVFCVNGVIPSNARPNPDPELPGYTFGGWYTNFTAGNTAANDNWSGSFGFSGTISQDTVVYARWSLNASVPYTVIVWQQNVNDPKNAENSAKTYDYVFSATGTAAPNTPISSLDLSAYTGFAGNENVSGDGKTHSFKGFKYRTYASANSSVTTVLANGTTVINVYYDRELVTLNFYTGSGSSWTLNQTMTGLYGSTLEHNDYEWPTNYWWRDQQASSGSTRTTFLDAFIPTTESMTVPFYGYTGTESATIRWYKQSVNGGDNYVVANTVGSAEARFNLSDKYNGFTCYRYSIQGPNGAWTEVGRLLQSGENYYYDADPSTPDDYDYIPSGYSNLYIQFKRNQYNINYMYGAFVDGSGVPLTAPRTGRMNQVPGVYYEADLSSYEGTYEPAEVEGYVFLGWFSDPSCTSAYSFTGKTMPANDITVYAKFAQRQYRVFLEPNYPDDPAFSIKWNEASQAMNFRVTYLDKISDGQPIEGKDLNDGYVLVGWYLDPEFEELYNFDTRLTDDIAEDYTDKLPEDQSRPWINKKVTLYAKWRKVLSGSNGINVVYNAVESDVAGHSGKFVEEGNLLTWPDPLQYMDKAKAIARTASTPDDMTNWQFLYWEILDKNGEGTGKFVYPGQEYVVDVQYAVEGTVRMNPVYGVKPFDASGFDFNIKGDSSSSGNGTKTEPTRATRTYQRVTTLTPGKRYLIAYTSGTTAYIMGNTYYSNGTRPRGVSATISNNTVTGDYDNYQFGVEYLGSEDGLDYYVFGSLYHYQMLSTESNYYPYFGYDSDYQARSIWGYNGTTLLNGAYSNLYLSFNNGYNANNRYFTTSTTATTISFFELVENTITGTDFERASELVVGKKYVIAYDNQAMGNVTLNSGHFLNAVTVAHSTTRAETVTVANSDVNNVLWEVIDAGSSDGYYLRNVADGSYLGYDSNRYLTTNTTTSSAYLWRYEGTDLKNNDEALFSSASYHYPYLFFSTRYMDFDTTNSGSNDIRIYTAPEAVTYTVTFQDWDGTELKTETVNEGEDATPPANPTRDGYTFNGWSGNYTNVHANETVIATYVQNSQQGYDEWRPVDTIEPNTEYLIGFVVNGTVYLAVNYREGQSGTAAHYASSSSNYYGYTAPATLDGDVVTGVTGYATDLQYCVWIFSESTGGQISSGYEAGTYLGTWSSTSFADLYPGSTNNTGWVYNDHSLYRAVGNTNRYAQYYSLNGNNNMRVQNEPGDTGYVQLYAKVHVDPVVKHTVTFVDGYTNSVITAVEVEDGQSATAPTPPNHEADHYFFQYWNPSDFSNVTEDMTVTAVYLFVQEGVYVVTFKDWDGTVLSAQTVPHGGSAVAPDDPERDGFTFVGWDRDYTNVTQNLVVYAKYSRTVSKSYTITIRAIYGPRVQQETTHITWHANNTTGDFKHSEDVLMNENIDIEFPAGDSGSWGAKGDPISVFDDLVWEDREFLGWARINIGDPETGVIYPEYDPTNEAYVKEHAYTEEDLYLKYIAPTGSETHGTFQAEIDGEWTDVQYVAADELKPYHGMYAVWGTVIYVYHSADNTVERIVTTRGNGNTSDNKEYEFFDITKYVASGYLYGGYYKNFAGKTANFNAKNVTNWSTTNLRLDTKGTYKDSTGTPYIADNGTINVAWDWNDSYNIDTDSTKAEPDPNGMSIKPVPGTTYYLKEVKDTMYLQPYLHYTYKLGTGEIKSLFLFSDLDDLNYQDTGFVIGNEWEGLTYVSVVSGVTIQTQYGNSTVTLTPKKIFGSKGVKTGYLSYLQVLGGSGSITLSNNQNVWQYWQTPDGLYVTGTVMRSYTGLDHVGGTNGITKHETIGVSYIKETQTALGQN